MDDSAFRQAFSERRLPAFHHHDHVRLAWIYLQEDATLRGLDRFVCALQAFAKDAGQPGIYHETMTWAYLLLLRERMARTSAATFADFAAAHPELLAWKPSILDEYYRPETLASGHARNVFVMPDRVPRKESGAT